MNFELLKAIRRRGLTQRKFAAMVGDHETVVSRVITGTWNLRPERKERYAKRLGLTGGVQRQLDRLVYAWHGRELMGCESPESESCQRI